MSGPPPSDPAGRIHRTVSRLLPWYVNASLDPAEGRVVEGHLDECAECREAMAQEGVVIAAIQGRREVALSPHPAQFERLMARVDAKTVRRPWRRLDAAVRRQIDLLVHATPGWVQGLVALQALVIALLVGTVVSRPFSAIDRQAHDPTLVAEPEAAPETAARLRIVFDEFTREREIRMVLVGLGGQIVAGPLRSGVYIVEFSPSEGSLAPGRLIERLRAQPKINFVESAEGVAGGSTSQ